MIELDIEQVERIEEIFRNTPNQIPKVISRTINRAIHTARTQAIRSIREKYIISRPDIMKTIRVKTASPNDLNADLRSIGKPIKLMNFKVNPGKPKKVKQVTVGVKKGSKKRIKGAFVAGMNSGHVNVFTREGRSRFPIRGHYGPSVPQMMGNEEVADPIFEKAKSEVDKRLEHEINRLLRG